MATATPPPLSRSWGVWSIAAAFYLAAFYFRVTPAVMTAELMRDFHITARGLGNLSAFYFYAYVAMQIPTGILVDSWGARNLLVAGSAAAAAGTFLFSFSDSFAVAGAGRAIVGAATAVGWVVALKLAAHWFPTRIFGAISGLALLIGNLGALVAQTPLRLMVEAFGWRVVGIASAAFILAVGVLAWLFVRNDPSEIGFASYFAAPDAAPGKAPGGSLLRIFTHRNVVLIVLAQGGFVGAILSFTGLWGPPYLRARFGLTVAGAAAVCSLMTACWAIACPTAGYLSDRLGRRKPVYVTGAGVAALGWISLFYAPGLSQVAFMAVAGLTAFATGALIVGFGYARESAPRPQMGSVLAAANVGNMIGPMILQPAIGWMLDRNAPAAGSHAYAPDDYNVAFILIAIWISCTFVLGLFTRETYCRQMP